jgi:nitrogen regulatory protein P-II 1
MVKKTVVNYEDTSHDIRDHAVNDDFKMIITIVKRGFSDPIVSASREAGAEGGTIFNGRGTGVNELKSIFGMPVQPEKEIILTIVQSSKVKKVLHAIYDAAKLSERGNGIAFVMPIDQVVGINHPLSED